MVSTDEAETKVCFGQTETGRSSPRKTNLHSMSWQRDHWKVSCVTPTTIPNSSGFTAVKIISPPHAMQRMSPTPQVGTPKQRKPTAGYALWTIVGKTHSVKNCVVTQEERWLPSSWEHSF